MKRRSSNTDSGKESLCLVEKGAEWFCEYILELPSEWFSSRQGRVLPLQREDIGVLPVSGEAAGFAVNEVVPRKFTPSVKRQRVFYFL